MPDVVVKIFLESWNLLKEASVYVLFGLVVAGLLKVFVSPASVARHLGRGRFSSVLKAALFGIPIPLCSCGVLPAAALLKRQGASNGATTAFLISTPESGVDSMALTYALMDPIMTVARPAAAFTTAAVAGVAENLFRQEGQKRTAKPELGCQVDGCCDGVDCLPEIHRTHHSFREKLVAGMKYAFFDLWEDVANWFLLGILLAGLITALIPAEVMTRYVGGGLSAMLIMLAAGIPLYICATASTPIAAALILKGISPGAALVFLLAGPATNVTSLTVIYGMLGKRATAVYLLTIAVMAVLCGLLLDQVYGILGVSARAVAGQAAEIIPHKVEVLGALVLLALSITPSVRIIRDKVRPRSASRTCTCGSEGCKPTAELTQLRRDP